MDPKDEHDIRDSFQALDSDHDGSLSLEEFYKLYIGLGFHPERIQLNEFEQMVQITGDTLVSVDVVVEKLSKVCITKERPFVFSSITTILHISCTLFLIYSVQTKPPKRLGRSFPSPRYDW